MPVNQRRPTTDVALARNIRAICFTKYGSDVAATMVCSDRNQIARRVFEITTTARFAWLRTSDHNARESAKEEIGS